MIASVAGFVAGFAVFLVLLGVLVVAVVRFVRRESARGRDGPGGQ